jgi:hypothetical protein
MNELENMVPVKFSSTIPKYLIEFSQDELDELAHIVPEELVFKETYHSLLAGRTLRMCVWNTRNIGPPIIVPGPASTTELVTLHFPLTLCGKTFVRYTSMCDGPHAGFPSQAWLAAQKGDWPRFRLRPVELPRLARPNGRFTAYGIRSIDELSGRNTGRL